MNHSTGTRTTRGILRMGAVACVVTLALLALAITAAGASARGAASPRDLLPASIKQSGVVKVATSIYAPVDFYKKDGKTLTGFDYDVMQAVAKKLGVTFKWSAIDFAAIIPGITSGQYDMATDLNATRERQKTVDFVTHFRDGSSILVAKGNPEGIKTLSGLCGKTVVMTKGSTQIALADGQSKKCKAAGKEAITQRLVPDDPPARLALKSGQAQAYLANTLASSYAAKNSGDFQVLPGVYDPVYAGIIFPKKSRQLRNAVRAGLNAVIKDGTYLKIMNKYGVGNNAVKAALINPAKS